MAHYNDLSSCDYFGQHEGKLVAVGWLEPGKNYRHGSVGLEFFGALVQLLVDPWQPVAAAGIQRCSFCRLTGGPMELRYRGSTIKLGSYNLFVPSEDCVFVAPSMIAHYIDAHDYAPPNEFQQAVLSCPLMGSVAYLKRIREHGIHKLGADHP